MGASIVFSFLGEIAGTIFNLILSPFAVLYIYGMYDALRKVKPEVARQEDYKKGWFVGLGIFGLVTVVVIPVVVIVFSAHFIGPILGNMFERGEFVDFGELGPIIK